MSDAKVTRAMFDMDCGDSSCAFALKRGGMRTNGGCRCLPRDELGWELRRNLTLWAQRMRQEVKHAEQRGAAAEREAVVALIDSCIGAQHHIAWKFAWRYLRELVVAGAKADHDQESGDHVAGDGEGG